MPTAYRNLGGSNICDFYIDDPQLEDTYKAMIDQNIYDIFILFLNNHFDNINIQECLNEYMEDYT